MNPTSSFSGLASGIQWRDLIDQIMNAEQIRRVNPLTTQVSQNQRRIDAWNNFRNLTSKLEAASRKLRDGVAFDTFTASAGTSPNTGRSLFTASASEFASPGSYQLEVLGVARAEKVGSGASVTDPTVGLGHTGTFLINEREIRIESGDSLNDIRTKINEANKGAERTGVTATILSTQPGEFRLMLTAESTGWNGIELRDRAPADGEARVLESLGFLNSNAPRSANTTADGRASTQRFTALDGEIPANSVATLLGLSSPPAVQRVIVGGQEITVDLRTDTLQELLNKVKEADPKARIVTESIGGREMHRLEFSKPVEAVDGTPEAREILDVLGLARAARPQAVDGSDAYVKLDSIAVTRRTNAITGVIPGVTVNIEAAEKDTTLDLVVARDTQQTVGAVREFATAYNDLLRFINNQRTAGQPLAGNSTLRGAMSSFTNVMLTPTSGLSTAFDRASLVGVSLSRSGELQVDETVLRSALDTNLMDVRALFSGETAQDGTRVDGLGGRMFAAANRVTRSGDGTVDLQVDSLNRSIDALNRRKYDAEGRLELRRETLLRQFMSMETAMNTIQGQGNWLTMQLQAMRPRER